MTEPMTDAAPTTPAGAPAAPVAPAPEPEAAADAAPATGRLDLGDPTVWHRVSPKYLVVEVVGTLIGGLLFCAGAAAVWILGDQQWALWVLVGLIAIFLVTLVVEPRRVRSIGYQLRADDLLFRRGIMFQRFVSVPYGRMQLVDITRSPIARALGLAELKFVTAAAATGVVIPGLPLEEAEELRDRLVALAESRRAGL
ncbi:PH domain-containing protein [Microterricola pindariensis]|uniref:PH domain-containing protein n=1 Tax=Microterricola pindariensis TaxID=478010 RepID=UPI001E32DFA8|nr:PH domain-containing protein [Microterricola pindariensis]